MKTPFRRHTQGFTLVELLVVIAIIAVLASAGFTAGNAAIQKARKTNALVTATAIESAVNNFYTEYGSMPRDGETDSDVRTNQTDGIKLAEVLLGMEPTSGTMLNTRAIKFLSVREGNSKIKKNGIIYNSDGTAIEGIFDPWGGGYFVMLDLNYDEKIDIPAGVLNGSRTLNGRRVAVWSRGADGISGSGGKTSDDVITWGN